MADSDIIFFGGFDYARGGTTERVRTSKEGDDCSLSVWRHVISLKKTTLVHMWRGNNVKPEQAAAIIHMYDMVFHFIFIVSDPGGGGIFVADELRNPIQDTGARRFPVTPIITMDDPSPGMGRPILILFKRGEPNIERAGHKFQSDSGIINKAHQLMKTAFEKKTIELPQVWPGWGKTGLNFTHPDAMRKWLNKHQGMTALDLAHAEIDLAILQLVTVDREMDKDGKPILDRWGMYSFKSKRKKDSAYALIYGYFAVWIWLELEILRQREKPVKKPFAVIAAKINVNSA